jgi:hypothetical protein
MPARPINAVEASGDLIEKNLRLFVPAGENALEIDPVAGAFGQFPGAADGEPDKFAGGTVGLRIQFVKRPLAFAPRPDQPAIQEQTKMCRDARLAQPRNLLQLIDRQLVFFQQRHNPQARGIGQGSERFQGG